MGKNQTLGMVLLLLVGAVLFGLVQIPQVSVGEPTEAVPSAVSCPSDGDTSITFDVVNAMNTTGSEGFDVTAYFIGASGHTVKITDTTSPTASTLNCGETYTVKIESTDGAGGDNSRAQSIHHGDGTISNGNVEFTAKGSSMSFEVAVDQQGVLESRMYDNLNAGHVFDGNDATATDYETDGVDFYSTTDNSTAYAVGSGGEVDVTLTVRATNDDENWNDRGTYILIDADATKWDTSNAVLSFDGQTLSNVQGSLSEFEDRKWSTYEMIYFVDSPITQQDKADIRLNMFALSGVDPEASDDIQIDIGAKGQYLQTASSSALAEGGVKDDSSGTLVRSLFDSSLQVS